MQAIATPTPPFRCYLHHGGRGERSVAGEFMLIWLPPPSIPEHETLHYLFENSYCMCISIQKSISLKYQKWSHMVTRNPLDKKYFPHQYEICSFYFKAAIKSREFSYCSFSFLSSSCMSSQKWSHTLNCIRNS